MFDIEDLFSYEELTIFRNVMPNAVDMEELRKTGVVTQTIEEHDGIITETVNYQSFDKKHQFTQSRSYPKVDERQVKLTEIREQKQLAVKNQNFEMAARAREQELKLMNT